MVINRWAYDGCIGAATNDVRWDCGKYYLPGRLFSRRLSAMTTTSALLDTRHADRRHPRLRRHGKQLAATIRACVRRRRASAGLKPRTCRRNSPRFSGCAPVPSASADGTAGGKRRDLFAMTPLDISATRIRSLLSNCASARYLAPDCVLEHITPILHGELNRQ